MTRSTVIAALFTLILAAISCGSAEPTISESWAAHWDQRTSAAKLEGCNVYLVSPTQTLEAVVDTAKNSSGEFQINGITYRSTRDNLAELETAIDESFAEECSDA